MKVVDMHCATISRLANCEECDLNQNNYHGDIEKLREGEYLLKNFAMFVPLGKFDNPEKEVFHLIARYLPELSQALRSHHYDDTSIAKIFHQNVLRVYETILK